MAREGGSTRGTRKRARVDWKKARKLYERDGLNYTQIGEQLGCRIETVSRHANAEGWVDPKKLARETRGQRAQKLLDEFIQRDAAAIQRNLTKKHELASRLLKLACLHIERLESETPLLLQSAGGAVVSEDPILAIRRLGLVLQNVEVVDRSLANLRDDGWRAARPGGDEASSADAAAVRAVLDEVERDRPRDR